MTRYYLVGSAVSTRDTEEPVQEPLNESEVPESSLWPN